MDHVNRMFIAIGNGGTSTLGKDSNNDHVIMQTDIEQE